MLRAAIKKHIQKTTSSQEPPPRSEETTPSNTPSQEMTPTEMVPPKEIVPTSEGSPTIPSSPESDEPLRIKKFRRLRCGSGFSRPLTNLNPLLSPSVGHSDLPTTANPLIQVNLRRYRVKLQSLLLNSAQNTLVPSTLPPFQVLLFPMFVEECLRKRWQIYRTFLY